MRVNPYAGLPPAPAGSWRAPVRAFLRPPVDLPALDAAPEPPIPRRSWSRTQSRLRDWLEPRPRNRRALGFRPATRNNRAGGPQHASGASPLALREVVPG